MDIRFLGHATFELSEGDARILVDPFLAPNNPKATVTADEVDPTHVLLTHGHVDHIADAVAVAKRTGAHCVAIVELATWLGDQGIEKVSDPNIGGTVEFDWGWVKLVQAFHTSDDSRRQGEAFARRPRDQRRRHDRLSPRRHRPLRRPEADRRAHPGGRRDHADRRPLHDGPPRRGGGRGVHRGRDRDPVPLRHVPADRDRRRGVQVGRREPAPARRWSCWSRARCTRWGPGPPPRATLQLERSSPTWLRLGAVWRRRSQPGL